MRSLTRREQYLEAIKKFRLMDDDFMSKVFDGSPECTEHVLRILLERDDIHVISVKTQYDIHSIEGHSIRLDILAKGADDVLFNVEIQRADRGAGQKRARYYSGLLDTTALQKGEDYGCLPDTYVIFITERDVLGEGKALYHVERMIDGEKEFNDGSHILYVNGAYRGEDPIGRLMHDFNCTEADDMTDTLLQGRTRYFKESTEGVNSMCLLMEQMRDEAAEKSAAEQAIKDAIDHVLNLMEHFKVGAEEAMNALKIPEEYRSAVLAALK